MRPLLFGFLPSGLLLASFVAILVAAPAQAQNNAAQNNPSGASGQVILKKLPTKATPTPKAAVPNMTGLTLVKDANLPFRVALPQQWQSFDLQDGLGGVSIANQKQAPFSMMRLLYMPKQGRSVDVHEEFDHFEATLRSSGVTFQRQSEWPMKCGGLSGFIRQYNLSSKAGSMTMKVWFGAGSRNFYSFQLTSPPINFATDSALFDRVLATVDF